MFHCGHLWYQPNNRLYLRYSCIASGLLSAVKTFVIIMDTPSITLHHMRAWPHPQVHMQKDLAKERCPSDCISSLFLPSPHRRRLESVLSLQKKLTKPCSVFLVSKEANNLHQSDENMLPSAMSSMPRWESMLPKTVALLP